MNIFVVLAVLCLAAWGVRITSYNVCYTKLLRLMRRGETDAAVQHLRAFLSRPPRGPDADRWIDHAQRALTKLVPESQP